LSFYEELDEKEKRSFKILRVKTNKEGKKRIIIERTQRGGSRNLC
jgi:hypothetical protein